MEIMKKKIKKKEKKGNQTRNKIETIIMDEQRC